MVLLNGLIVQCAFVIATCCPETGRVDGMLIKGEPSQRHITGPVDRGGIKNTTHITGPVDRGGVKNTTHHGSCR